MRVAPENSPKQQVDSYPPDALTPRQTQWKPERSPCEIVSGCRTGTGSATVSTRLDNPTGIHNSANVFMFFRN